MSGDDKIGCNLSDAEQAALEVFENFRKRADEYAIGQFVDEVNARSFDVEALKKVAGLIRSEDIRFVPVIACSFADETLLQMFKRELPESVPSGRSSMLSGFGSLSGFSQRIQIAYAFNYVNPFNLSELDKVRRIRNRVSHNWDISEAIGEVENLVRNEMEAFEAHLVDGKKLTAEEVLSLEYSELFRVRVIWLLGSIFYEGLLWPRAVKMRLNPMKALYGETTVALLRNIAGVCLSETRMLTRHGG